MTLRSKISKVVDQLVNESSNFQRDQYEDDYDGFTHSSYSGLIDDIENELFEEGYEDDAPIYLIEEIAFELF